MSKEPSRNALCYCGSGKKYKKCHWVEEQKSKVGFKAQAYGPQSALLKHRFAQIQIPTTEKSPLLNRVSIHH